MGLRVTVVGCRVGQVKAGTKFWTMSILYNFCGLIYQAWPGFLECGRKTTGMARASFARTSHQHGQDHHTAAPHCTYVRTTKRKPYGNRSSPHAVSCREPPAMSQIPLVRARVQARCNKYEEVERTA